LLTISLKKKLLLTILILNTDVDLPVEEICNVNSDAAMQASTTNQRLCIKQRYRLCDIAP
jgi:hypothetical protein